MGLAQPPTLPWTAKTLWALARLQEERQELTRAIELYQRLAQDFPTHEQAETSLWLAGWLSICQRHYQAATTLWQRFCPALSALAIAPPGTLWPGPGGPAGRTPGYRDTPVPADLADYLSTITAPRDTRVARGWRAPCVGCRQDPPQRLLSLSGPAVSRKVHRGSPARPAFTSSASRNSTSADVSTGRARNPRLAALCPPLQRPSTSSPRCMSTTSNARQPSAPSTIRSRP